VQTIEARRREAGGGRRLRHTCRCSCLQICDEQVLDLLDPHAGKQCTVSHSSEGMHVDGLHEQVVLSGVHCFVSPPPWCTST
jgi:hypothetical protein